MNLQALALMLLLGAGACARPADNPLPESLARLEYMVLSKPVPGSGTWLLAGRFEVTRSEFGSARRPSEKNLPVSMVSYDEAEAWCSERHLRLPTVAEWRHLATAGRGEFLVAETARNGLSLGLRRALPVGVFERGRTALGAYDFLGNVREWARDGDSKHFFACGGSFAARNASTHPGMQLEMLPQDRAEDVGFRYFADAEAYMLSELVPLWNHLHAAQQALVLENCSVWRAESRTALAASLRQKGAPEDFCNLLARP